jgi:hypothetical protein
MKINWNIDNKNIDNNKLGKIFKQNCKAITTKLNI